MSASRPTLTLVTHPRPSGTSLSLAKGMAAGLAGGLVAMAARSYLKKSYAPRTHGPITLELPAGATADGSLVVQRKSQESRALQWGLGAAAGAAYGAVAEYYPSATSKDGATFGLALGAFTQDGPLTMLGLRPPGESTLEKTKEMTFFVLFGVITEAVRRIVRRML
ncbi:MAG: DUF1440 domain-containing protein [Acidobacteriaceae bacterium]|nr:DUF1440 domain-containing protein [Acidobacteriaceae bacterium]